MKLKPKERGDDPLAGKREDINAGYSTAIFWRDDGDGCPVEVGETFSLRSGGITITRRERIRKNGQPYWRADFKRIGKPAKPYLLKRGGGYTDDPNLAMRSQDDAHSAATLDPIHPDHRSEAHRAAGEPPEPEGVPPDEIGDYRKSIEAQMKQRQEKAERRDEEEARRRQERAIRDELRVTLRGLHPPARAHLLAQIQRQIQEAA